MHLGHHVQDSVSTAQLRAKLITRSAFKYNMNITIKNTIYFTSPINACKQTTHFIIQFLVVTWMIFDDTFCWSLGSKLCYNNNDNKKGQIAVQFKIIYFIVIWLQTKICYTIPFHIIKNTILVELCTLTHGQLIYEPVLQNSIQHQPSNWNNMVNDSESVIVQIRTYKHPLIY